MEKGLLDDCIPRITLTEEEMLERLRTYVVLDRQAKEAADEMKPLNQLIKDYMRQEEKSQLTVDGYVASYTVQERVSLLSEKLIQRLKTLGLEDAILMIESVNNAVVEQMLYDGRLTAAQIEDCREVKPVEVLKISKAKAQRVTKEKEVVEKVAAPAPAPKSTNSW